MGVFILIYNFLAYSLTPEARGRGMQRPLVVRGSGVARGVARGRALRTVDHPISARRRSPACARRASSDSDSDTDTETNGPYVNPDAQRRYNATLEEDPYRGGSGRGGHGRGVPGRGGRGRSQRHAPNCRETNDASGDAGDPESSSQSSRSQSGRSNASGNDGDRGSSSSQSAGGGNSSTTSQSSRSSRVSGPLRSREVAPSSSVRVLPFGPGPGPSGPFGPGGSPSQIKTEYVPGRSFRPLAPMSTGDSIIRRFEVVGGHRLLDCRQRRPRRGWLAPGMRNLGANGRDDDAEFHEEIESK